MLPWILLSIVALAGVLLGERTGRPALVWVAKPLASAGFLGAAVAVGALTTAYGNTVFLALAWCALGDVLLIARGSRLAFLLGLSAFLVGHLGYLAAFSVIGLDVPVFALALLGLGVPAAVIFRWLRPHLPRGMVAPVLAYIAVISAMVAGAIGIWLTPPAPLVLVAAVLFYLSDLTVARQRFVAPAILNRAVGLPLYYTAQFIFVWTAATPG